MKPKAPHANCEDCPLRSCAFVPSYLPEGAQYIALGEAPGYQETQQRKPFVGPSGQLLSGALGNVGADLESFARINAVSCKAPGNEVPTEALVACMPRLQHELGTLRELPILALGATAMQVLDHMAGASTREGITKRRGSWYTLKPDSFRDTPMRYLPTFHPAYILRAPGFIMQLYADLKTFLRKEPDLDVWAIKYVVVDRSNWGQFAKALESLPDRHLVAFDTETDGLQLWHTPDRRADDLLCLVITTHDHFSYIITPDTLDQDRFKWVMKQLDRFYTVAHNGKFDQNVCQNYGANFKLRDDTMLLSYNTNEIRGYHGLKGLATQHLGAADYEKELIDNWFTENKIPDTQRKYSLIPKPRLYRYAAIDGVVTRLLYPILLQQNVEDEVLTSLETLRKGSDLTQAAEHRGIKIDRKYLRQAEIRLSTELAHYKQEMWVLLEKEYLQTNKDLIVGRPYYKDPKKLTEPDTKDTKDTKAFNPGSDDQMQWAIYSFFKLKHTKVLSFKTKATSTNEEALESVEAHPFVDLLKKYRRVGKILSTYVRGLERLADVNDRVHVNFNLHGTETGRLSANDGLHGIPRAEDFYGKIIQGAFIAEKGFKLVKADFSQAELRAFAAESGEDFLLNAFRQGWDVHMLTALVTEPFKGQIKALDPAYLSFKYARELEALKTSNRTHHDTIKYYRQISKQINFGGLVYLGGPTGIAAMLHGYGIEIKPQDLAPSLLDYRGKMPKATAWQQGQFRKAKKDGFVQSRLGRKRRFPLIVEDNLEEIRKASVNAPIQSVASDLNLLAAYSLWADFGLQVVHMIHDSIILEVPEELAPWAAETTKSTMESLAASVFPEVPWVADVEIVDRLYEDRPEDLL